VWELWKHDFKKAKDVRYSYEKGVRMFASDSEADLRKRLAKHHHVTGLMYDFNGRTF